MQVHKMLTEFNEPLKMKLRDDCNIAVTLYLLANSLYLLQCWIDNVKNSK